MSSRIFWAGGPIALPHDMETGKRCRAPRVDARSPASRAECSTDLLSLVKGREKCHGASQENPSCQQRPQRISYCAWLVHAVTGTSNFILCHRSQRRGGAGSSESMGSKAVFFFQCWKGQKEDKVFDFTAPEVQKMLTMKVFTTKFNPKHVFYKIDQNKSFLWVSKFLTEHFLN